MVFVKTFVSELSKKIEMLQAQILQFEEKVSIVSEVTDLISKITLKDIADINGDDLALLSDVDFKKVIDIVHVDNEQDCLNTFINYAVINKLYAKFLLDGNVDKELENNAKEANKWLDEQATIIKEFILEFKESNESYLNSLKQSDFLYKKYMNYFDDGELVKPISNIEEFNDVLKKSGLIMNEKWQLLKYIAKRNIDLSVQDDDLDLMSDVDELLKEDGNLLEGISEDKLNFYISLIDMSEEDIKKLNLSNDELIKYQKIPILNSIKELYEEIQDLVKQNNSANEKQIEKKKKELMSFKNSYDFFKNLK